MTETELPSSSTSDERRSYMYLYDGGHVQLINQPQNVSGDLVLYDSMSVHIGRLQNPLSTPTLFRTCDLRNPPEDPTLRWHVLGFEHTSGSQFEQYQLGHSWGTNRLSGDMVANPWLWLLSGTEHLDPPGGGGGNARCFLSGRLAMFWGLVALSFGWTDLDTLNLGVQDNQLNIVWPNRQPYS